MCTDTNTSYLNFYILQLLQTMQIFNFLKNMLYLVSIIICIILYYNPFCTAKRCKKPGARGITRVRYGWTGEVVMPREVGYRFIQISVISFYRRASIHCIWQTIPWHADAIQVSVSSFQVSVAVSRGVLALHLADDSMARTISVDRYSLSGH